MQLRHLGKPLPGRAGRASGRDFDRVIVLEDDVFFYDAWDANVPRIKRAMDLLPADWWGLYLGHVPIRPISCAADCCGRGPAARTPTWPPAALNWLATTPPMGPDVPTWPLIGQSIAFGYVEPSRAVRTVSNDRSAAVPRRLPGRQPRRRIGAAAALSPTSIAGAIFSSSAARALPKRPPSFFRQLLADARVVAPAGRPLRDTDRGSESLPMVDVSPGRFEGSPAGSRFPSTLILCKPSRCHQ